MADVDDAAADLAVAKYKLDSAKKRRDAAERDYRKTGSMEDARDWQEAMAAHAQASHVWKEADFAARLQASNEQAAAKAEAARQRQAEESARRTEEFRREASIPGTLRPPPGPSVLQYQQQQAEAEAAREAKRREEEAKARAARHGKVPGRM
jgi:hypothetical protein